MSVVIMKFKIIYRLKEIFCMEDDVNIENDSYDLLVVFISMPNC